jgi:hypothetical protein
VPGKRRVSEIIFGAPLDPFSKETRRHVVLVAFLAWIGLGADGSNRWGGVYAVDWMRREFPGHFRNFVFMSARTVDAKCFSGSDEMEQERKKAEETLSYFVIYCNNRGLAAKTYVGFGIDPIEELTNLAEKIRQGFPHSIFFTSKLIFEHDNSYIRQLHSEAAITMLRPLHLLDMPMVVLPMRL